jgi:hypothetical protein
VKVKLNIFSKCPNPSHVVAIELTQNLLDEQCPGE